MGRAGVSSSSSSGAQQQHHQQQQQQLLAATAPVRWALDTGLSLPSHVTPHQAAAALLLLLSQLPASLMPPDVSGILVHFVPPAPACSSLLSDTMSVAEWATLRMVLGLCKAALAPEASPFNGLTLTSLAGMLAGHVFGGPAQQAAAPPGLAANRIAFMMTLLDPLDALGPGAAGTQQQQQHHQHNDAAGGAAAGSSQPEHALHHRTRQPAESLI